MLRPRFSNRALSQAVGNRPRWLTNGVVNLAVLCALIVLMGMLSPRLSRTDAGIVFFVGLGLFALAAASFIGVTRRLAERFELLSDAHAAADAVLVALRWIGCRCSAWPSSWPGRWST